MGGLAAFDTGLVSIVVRASVVRTKTTRRPLSIRSAEPKVTLRCVPIREQDRSRSAYPVVRVHIPSFMGGAWHPLRCKPFSRCSFSPGWLLAVEGREAAFPRGYILAGHALGELSWGIAAPWIMAYVVSPLSTATVLPSSTFSVGLIARSCEMSTGAGDLEPAAGLVKLDVRGSTC
jgi:hypothetical protein